MELNDCVGFCSVARVGSGTRFCTEPDILLQRMNRGVCCVTYELIDDVDGSDLNRKPCMHYIRIVVAGRHPVVLEGLRSVLEPLGDFKVVASCGDSTDLVRAIERLAPDIAIVDNCACNVTELQIVAAAAKSSTELVLLTGAAGSNELYALEATGICSLIPKETPSDVLIHFLRKLGAGQKQTLSSAEEHVTKTTEKKMSQ